MSWAEVKKINSDMSVSLDELFKNSMRIYNSDTLLIKEVYNGSVQFVYLTDTPVGGSYTMLYPGVVTIKCIYQHSLSGGEVRVFVNGVKVSTLDISSDVIAPVLTNIEVQRGNVITFSTYSRNSGSFAKTINLSINGFVGLGNGAIVVE